jgi:hypothetical protein
MTPSVRRAFGRKAGALLLAGLLWGCDLLCAPTEEIVLPAEGTPPRWITIEFGNPDCAPIGGGSRRIVVPPSGYACTSSPMNRGWVHLTFVALGNTGRRVDVGKNVHQKHTAEVVAASTTDGGVRSCAPNAFFFWYGDPDAMSGDSALAYRQRHSECP